MLKRNTLTSQVIDYILNLIKERQVRPGDRLPTEKELGATLGVSRTCVREAMKSLESLHLVQIRPRIGAIVLEPSASAIFSAEYFAATTDLQEEDHLLEFRTVIEVGMASIAAEKADQEDLDRMRRCLHNYESEIRSDNVDPQTDLSFHEALALATKNPLALMVWKVISRSMGRIAPMACKLPHVPEDSLRGHKRIFRAIENRDPTKARRAMREHLQENAHYWRILRAQRASPADGDSLEAPVEDFSLSPAATTARSQ